jgi:GT2 family glycosyltransferase
MDDSGTQPFFSAIIPTFERNDLLATCLLSLAPGRQRDMTLIWPEGGKKPVARDGQQSAPPNADTPTYEVIVADDGRSTTAETMIRERFPWARWIGGPGTGPAANRNRGAALARGTWLAFTDDDCLPEPGWLASYQNAIGQHPDLRVFEGQTIPDRPRQTLAEHAPVGLQGGNLWSCNFVIRRSEFERLGGFDPRFRVCMEDNDFALRVREAGLTFPFIESARVVHPWRPRKPFSDGWKSNRSEIDDHRRFRSKHREAGNLTAFRMIRLGLRVFACDVGFILKHRDWKGIAYAVTGLLHILNIAWCCRQTLPPEPPVTSSPS